MSHKRIREYLVELERERFSGKPKYACIEAGRLLEAVMKLLLSERGITVQKDETFGPLFNKCRAVGIFEHDEIGSISKMIHAKRNAAAHDKIGSETLHQDDADEVTYLLSKVLVRLDLLDDQDLRDCRREGINRAARPRQIDWRLSLDRVEQVQQLESIDIGGSSVIILVITGEILQGHQAFVERSRLELGLRAAAQRVPWPAPLPNVANRLGALIEALVQLLSQTPTSNEPTATDLDEACARAQQLIRAKTAKRPLIVRHQLKSPRSDDIELSMSYLEHIWSTLVDLQHPALVAFEVSRTLSAGIWPFSRATRNARQQSRTTRQFRSQLQRKSETSAWAGRFAIIPELASVTAEEIERFLTRDCRYRETDLSTRAQEIYLNSQGGRYELALSYLEDFFNRKAGKHSS